MTPDTPVWISTPRSGISYHRIDDTGRKTNCGRYIGAGDGYVVHGYVQPLADVVDRYGSRPCRACNGSGAPPVVVPRGSRWTT